MGCEGITNESAATRHILFSRDIGLGDFLDCQLGSTDMKILILGIDGYLGWPTAMYLAARGHKVLGTDSLYKRQVEDKLGIKPLVETPMLADKRTPLFARLTKNKIWTEYGDITRGLPCVKYHKPDAIVHFAEQPSAPYSQMNRLSCLQTAKNNILGTLSVLWAMKEYPDTHLVKLGTMGEYGTPDIDIEEGWLEVEHNGRRDRVLYPKKPGSFYHASKVADSVNLEMACRMWDLRVTDLNQGVVYGIETDETSLHPDLRTSFHYDGIFGTALNRFIAQAVCDHPLTVYGGGSQTRGWLNIRDTLQCIELACLHPAERGEFRVFNQFTEQFSVRQLAEKVAALTGATVSCIDNPRVEQEHHHYEARHTGLRDLGLVPHLLTDRVLSGMLEQVAEHADNIDREQLMPRVTWK